MKNSYLIFALSLVLLISIGITGFSASMSTPEDTLVYAYYGPPETIDPAITSGTAGETIVRNLYDSLFRPGPQSDMEAKPNLVDSWDVSNDGKTFTFHLREDVKFHNGNPLTAEDVVYTLNRVLELGRTSARDLENAHVTKEGIEQVDQFTVKITTERSSPFLTDVLANTGTSIIDKEWALEHGDNIEEGEAASYISSNENGTGPYELKEWVKRDRLKLEKFEDYWRGWEGKHVENVQYLIVPEYSTRLMSFLSGDIDIAYISQEHLSDVKDKPGIVVDTSGLDNYILYIWMNTEKDFLNDKRVRQALNYSFPYEQVLSTAYKGTAIKGTGIAANIVKDYPEGVEWYEQDLEKAKQLLAEAGYEEGFSEKLTFYYDTGRSARRKIGLIWKENLNKLGIDIELQSRDWPVMADKVDKGDYELYASGDWTSLPTAGGYTDQMETRNLGVSGNFAWIKNNTLNVLNEKARTIFDNEKRTQIYREMHGVIFDLAPIISVVQMRNINVYGEWVKGYKYYPWSHPYFYDVYKEG